MHHARAEQKGALGSSGCAQVLTYIHHLNAADYEPVSAVNTIVMHFLTRMQVPLCVGVLGLFGRRACNWLSCSSRALQHSRREDDRWGKRALSQWRESVARAARMKQPLIEFYFKPEQQTAGFKRLGFKTRPAWELGDSIRKKSVKYWLTKKKSMNCFKCSIIELHLCCSFWVILDKYEHFSVTRIYTGMIHDGVSKVDDVSFKWIFFSLVSLFYHTHCSWVNGVYSCLSCDATLKLGCGHAVKQQNAWLECIQLEKTWANSRLLNHSVTCWCNKKEILVLSQSITRVSLADQTIDRCILLLQVINPSMK